MNVNIQQNLARLVHAWNLNPGTWAAHTIYLHTILVTISTSFLIQFEMSKKTKQNKYFLFHFSLGTWCRHDDETNKITKTQKTVWESAERILRNNLPAIYGNQIFSILLSLYMIAPGNPSKSNGPHLLDSSKKIR